MERFTKITVALWACLAIALQTRLLAGGWPHLPWLTLGAALATLLLGRLDRRLLAPLFIVPYVFPALVRVLHGVQYAPFAVLWMGALVGAILPDALRSPWHIPRRWRGALVFAALVVVISSALSTWREVDGTLTLLTESGPTYWRGVDPPSFPIRWILNVSLILVTGVLWFDWLCGARDFDFERTVVTPLVFSAMAMATVSAYQLFVDVHFLNETVFGSIARASGAMYDANAAGMLAAMWLGGTFLWAWRLRGWRVYVAPVVIVLNGIAVWASGSRTALAVATMSTLVIVFFVALAGPRINPRRIAIGLGLAGVALGLLVAVGSANPDASNPGARVWHTLTSSGRPATFAQEMWSRNGYGTAAVVLIKQFPLVGVGVGSFHAFVSDVGAARGIRLPPDNAQNWVRHQIVEFGFLGALGWVIWFVTFASFVLRSDRAAQSGTWVLRGILGAFGVISCLGMSGQDVMVAFTFWTLAFWYVSLAASPPTGGPLGRWTWLGIGVALTVFAVGTSAVAATSLRVPERARRSGRNFAYGYADPEPAGPNAGYRRTLWRAVALVDTAPRWMAVTARLERPQDDLVPIDVRVWSDGEVVLKAQLTNTVPVTGFIPVNPASTRVLLETSARGARAWQLWPFPRDPGLLLKWEFVDDAPSRYRRYDERPMEGR